MKIEALKKKQVEIGKAIVEINRGMLGKKIEQIPKPEKGNFWTILNRTTPKLTKKNRVDGGSLPYEKVFKTSTVQLQIGVSYEACVNGQRAREGKATDFVSSERKWGERVDGSLIKHTKKGETKPRYYLELPARKCLAVAYEDEVGNSIEGEALEYLKGFLPTKSASRQGVDKPIEWRTFALDSIIALSANHVFWVIVD